MEDCTSLASAECPMILGKTKISLENIRRIIDDEAIISVHRKCDICSKIYDATMEPDLERARCPSCNARAAPAVVVKKKTLPSSGYSSLLPYQIPQVKEFLESAFPKPPVAIVDASAHIGGDAIHFAKLWPQAKITAIDNDGEAIACLKLNVSTSCINLDNFEIVFADSTEWIPTNLKPADFYYFDPPWGGPNYCSEEEVSLFMNSSTQKVPIVDLINFVFDHNLAPCVLLKAPRNFAYPSFKAAVHGTTKLHYIRKPQKRGAIAYSLILITVAKG